MQLVLSVMAHWRPLMEQSHHYYLYLHMWFSCRGKKSAARKSFSNRCFMEGSGREWIAARVFVGFVRERANGSKINHLNLAIPAGYLLHSPSLIALPSVPLNQYIKADIQLLQIQLHHHTYVFSLSEPRITSWNNLEGAFVLSCLTRWKTQPYKRTLDTILWKL